MLWNFHHFKCPFCWRTLSQDNYSRLFWVAKMINLMGWIFFLWIQTKIAIHVDESPIWFYSRKRQPLGVATCIGGFEVFLLQGHSCNFRFCMGLYAKAHSVFDIFFFWRCFLKMCWELLWAFRFLGSNFLLLFLIPPTCMYFKTLLPLASNAPIRVWEGRTSSSWLTWGVLRSLFRFKKSFTCTWIRMNAFALIFLCMILYLLEDNDYLQPLSDMLSCKRIANKIFEFHSSTNLDLSLQAFGVPCNFSIHVKE